MSTPSKREIDKLVELEQHIRVTINSQTKLKWASADEVILPDRDLDRLLDLLLDLDCIRHPWKQKVEDEN